MKRGIKKILLIGIIIFLMMQLYQPARNENSGQDFTNDFTKVYNVPANVETILKTSCYDCHSNNTNYPLYAYMQPIRMFMERHIKKAKKKLNFNEFGMYSQRKQENKLNRIVKQIKSNEMPLASYTLMHSDAKLTSAQKETLINWINTLNKDE